MRGKSSGGARQQTQQRDGDAASDRATQRDVYVSDVLERPELPEPLQVTAVHESPAVRLILCTVVCTVCVCGSLLVSARYGSVGIGLLATTGVLELVYLQPLALRKNVHQSWPLALNSAVHLNKSLSQNLNFDILR